MTGTTIVNVGVTLTIAPGVNIDFNGYNLEVNGTLQAIGSNADKIYIKGGQIIFNGQSSPWDAKKSSGDIIKNVIMGVYTKPTDHTVSVSSINSLDIDSCTIDGGLAGLAGVDVGSFSLITNSNITADVIVGSNTTVSNNILTHGISSAVDSTISNNIINGGINAQNSLIINNTISASIYGSSLTILNNTAGFYPPSTFGAAVTITGGSNLISNNVLSGAGENLDIGGRPTSPIGAIDVQSGNATITNNILFTTENNPGITWNEYYAIVNAKNNTVNVVSQATTQPTSSTSPSPTSTLSNPTDSPSQTSSTGVQQHTQSSLDWTQVALLTTLAIIVALIIFIIALARKKNPKKQD